MVALLGASGVATEAGRSADTPSLTIEQIENARYDCEQGLGTFVLKDGSFTAEYQRIGIAGITRAKPMITFGDLDGDRVKDAAVGIFYDEGGSGTWVFLYALVNDKGRPKCAAAAQLGDRPHVRAISIRDGRIRVDMNLRKEGDGMAQASLPVLATYTLTGDKLVADGIPENVVLFDLSLDPKSPLVTPPPQVSP